MASTTDDEEKTTAEPSPPTGHEQLLPVLISLALTIGAIVFGCIFRQQHSEYQQNAGFYIVTGIQTLLAFMLPIAYPGFACFAYTAGLGCDGPGTRFEAFYINTTMGMVLGIPNMAFVDHIMFILAPLVAILGWMPWLSCQVIASGMAFLCGLYMSLWIPTNVAMNNAKDPAPWVMLIVFLTCSVYRVPDIATWCPNCSIVLGAFMGWLVLLAFCVFINAFRRIRGKRVEKTLALVERLHSDIGEGPVWAQWPKDKQFPQYRWWFERIPNSSKPSSAGTEDESNGVWPYGPWPSENNSTSPPEEMVEAAATEMKEEMPKFMPLWFVICVLTVSLVGLIVAAAVVCTLY